MIKNRECRIERSRVDVTAKTAVDIYMDKWLQSLRQPAVTVRNVIENNRLVQQMENDRLIARSYPGERLTPTPVPVKRKRGLFSWLRK